MQEILLKIRYFERGLSESRKIVNFNFSSEVIKNKRGVELVTSRFWGYETSSEKFLYYYRTKFGNIISSGFWVIPKIILSNFWKLIHGIINYSISICPFVSGECGKEGEKLQKIEYLKNKNSFLDKIKNTFHTSWRVVIRWKNENLIKNSRHKL